MSHLVEIRGLTKTYVRGREKIAALYDITLDIPRGTSWPSWARLAQARRPCST